MFVYCFFDKFIFFLVFWLFVVVHSNLQSKMKIIPFWTHSYCCCCEKWKLNIKKNNTNNFESWTSCFQICWKYMIYLDWKLKLKKNRNMPHHPPLECIMIFNKKIETKTTLNKRKFHTTWSIQLLIRLSNWIYYYLHYNTYHQIVIIYCHHIYFL